ncbi:MAG: hypothetical protein J7549_14035 [Variovorax sp.]|nr:hypothetical protein [Variovorax sp.]
MLARPAHRYREISPYVATVGYSLTFFFHMTPGATETATRLPLGAPWVAGPDASPALQGVIGGLFAVFLIGAALQVLRLRAARTEVAERGLRGARST